VADASLRGVADTARRRLGCRLYDSTLIERLYARWGWLAVFVTPAIVSGTGKMRPMQFAIWNFIDSAIWTVSVAASAYGVGKLATEQHTVHDVAVLVIGLAAATVLTILAVRRH
jgi:membrane protein DedA with SNARE-associated domain